MLAKVDIKDIRHIESNMQKVYNAGYVLWERAKEDPCQVNCQTACESGCQSTCQTSCQTAAEKRCKITCQTSCQTACEKTTQCGSRQICVIGQSPCGTCEKKEGSTS